VYYDGKQKSLALDPLPPVAYENRYDSDSTTSAMRFAGWYYLSVTLNPEIGEEYGGAALPLTLRVNVRGEAEDAPAYAGPQGTSRSPRTTRRRRTAARAHPRRRRATR